MLINCSPDRSPSRQSSSSGDLLPEMMESETPPASPPHGAGDPEVSSRRSPDPPRKEANTSAALSPKRLAPTWGDKKGPVQYDNRPDTLTGLLEQASLSEDHHVLMGTVFEKISPATSGLNGARCAPYR